MMRRVMLLTAITAVVLSGQPLGAYLKLGTVIGAGILPLRWAQRPIRYYVTNRDLPGVTAPQLQAATQRAFDAWIPLVSDAPAGTAPATSSFAGFTSADPFVDDGMSVIGFRARPDLDRTLGATTFTVDNVTGEILQSDIFLNSTFAWSVASGGEPPRYDVQSIVTHEIGHLFGLSHSALGETEITQDGRRRVMAKGAVMFPIAYPAGNIEDRTIEPDDAAGYADIYSGDAFRRQTGSISGRVLMNGGGVFGAHVTAFNPSTGVTIGTFTLTPEGDFVLAGLAAGMYVVRAEPLDDADVQSFFDTDTVVNINFKVAYASKLIPVPAGGSGGNVEIKVSSK